MGWHPRTGHRQQSADRRSRGNGRLRRPALAHRRPIGMVLTGVSVASLVTVYVQNHRRIWDQQKRYGKLIGEYRVRYDQIRAKYVEGLVDEQQRDLMIDGLMNRFFEDIDADPSTPTTSGIGPKRDAN